MKEFKRGMHRRCAASGCLYKARRDDDILQHCCAVGKKFPRGFYGHGGRSKTLWAGQRFWEQRYEHEKICGD